MARKLYKNLRCKMTMEDIDQKYLAKLIERSCSYVGERMRGLKPFDLDDVYRICNLLKIEPQEIAEYFPEGEGKEKRVRNPEKVETKGRKSA